MFILLDLFRLTDWPISATWLHYPTWSVGIFCALRTLSRMEQCSKKAFTLSSATLEEFATRRMRGCNNGFNKSPIAKTDVVADIVAALGQLTNGAVDERVSIIALIASMIDHRWRLCTMMVASQRSRFLVTTVLTWQIRNFEEHGKRSHRYHPRY